MNKQEIENKISPIFSVVMWLDIEEIDVNSPLFAQHGIDEIDILDLLKAIDKEFDTHLFYDDQNIDLLKVSIEDIVTLVEQEVNHKFY